MRVQECLDIPQSYPVCMLSESKTEKLIATGKFSDLIIAFAFFERICQTRNVADAPVPVQKTVFPAFIGNPPPHY